MLNAIEGLPSGTIGFVASDTIGLDDRNIVLEPTIEWALESGRVRLLYVLDPCFRGYDHGCPFDDVVFGSRHFTDFERIAFVADDCPFRRAVSEVADLMPTDLRVFGLHELEAAKIWLADRSGKGQTHMEAGHHGLSAWLADHISSHHQ